MLARSPSAVMLRRQRQARYKQRQKNGAVILRLEILDYPGLLEALILAGRISERDSADRLRVEAAATEALADLTKRWREER